MKTNYLGITIFSIVIIYSIVMVSISYTTDTLNEITSSIIENKVISTSNKSKVIHKELIIESDIIKATVFGYNSLVAQTDSSPFITASGERTRWGIIANNCLEFGTEVRVAGEVFEVQDRMSSRYGCEVFDIWFGEYWQAKQWGKRYINVEIYRLP